jgi:hypothetical protein
LFVFDDSESSPAPLQGEDSRQAADMEHNVQLADVMGAEWLAPLASIRGSLASIGIAQLLEEAAVGVACAHVKQVPNALMLWYTS